MISMFCDQSSFKWLFIVLTLKNEYLLCCLELSVQERNSSGQLLLLGQIYTAWDREQNPLM